ncbi:hypothetical protein NNL26_03265 [Micrococcus luteus]|uniref:hypothetical protein n=1 Tax=Micrococcus luteus TaxID=1270 RepID=UPI0021023A08|nr:hypothetical protein [Micrococcus luteus]UTX35276.1 hypothetical protein NNL26_03265 [Micrococcus luteus]
MKTPWATDVALNLSRLMEKTWSPSHGGLDTIFGKLAINSPETDRQGSSINKVKRLRRAFDQADARGEQAVVNLVKEIIEEMRFKGVISANVRLTWAFTSSTGR